MKVPLSNNDVERSIRHAAILAKAGIPISDSDLLISSIAIANDLTVISRNELELLRVPSLKVEVGRPGGLLK